MAKLKEIMADLITQAKATPGQAQRRQLGKGLQVIVKVDGAELVVGGGRSGEVGPSDEEMRTVLRDAGAPEYVLKGIGGGLVDNPLEHKQSKSFTYAWARWPMQPELFESDIDEYERHMMGDDYPEGAGEGAK